MKLAIFFVIVGISSCFVDADHVQDCQQKMNHGQAQNIVAQLIQVLALSHKIKDITDLCGIRSCWESIIFLIKLIAAATNCPYDAICWTMVTNLPQSHSTQAKQIQAALLAGNVGAWLNVNVKVKFLADTVTHTVRILATTHGHNCDDLAGEAVLSLAGTISEMGRVVNSLKLCGINLDFVTKTVGSLTSLIPGTGPAILCGGGLGPVDLKNLGPLIKSLLGVGAAPALAFLSGVVGPVLGLVGNTVGGLLGSVPLLSGGAGLGGVTGGAGGVAGPTANLAGSGHGGVGGVTGLLKDLGVGLLGGGGGVADVTGLVGGLTAGLLR